MYKFHQENMQSFNINGKFSLIQDSSASIPLFKTLSLVSCFESVGLPTSVLFYLGHNLKISFPTAIFSFGEKPEVASSQVWS